MHSLPLVGLISILKEYFLILAPTPFNHYICSSLSFFVLCALRKSDEMFQAQLNGALTQNPGLRLSLLGDLNVSLSGISVLPCVSRVAWLLDQEKGLTEGRQLQM